MSLSSTDQNKSLGFILSPDTDANKSLNKMKRQLQQKLRRPIDLSSTSSPNNLMTQFCKQRRRTLKANRNLFAPITFVSNRNIVILTLISIINALINIQPTYQQTTIDFCPKVCTCDEQNLEVLCKGSIGANSLPHTLNPSAKKIVINNAQTTQFSGLNNYKQLETLDLAYNKISFIEFNDLSENNLLKSLNTSHNSIYEIKDSFVSALVASALSELDVNNPSSDISESSHLKKLRKSSKVNVVDFILSHNRLTIIKNYTFLRWHRLQRLDLSFNLIESLEGSSFAGLSRLEKITLRGNNLKHVPSTALQSSARSIFNPTISDGHTSSLSIIDISQNNLTFLEPNSFSLLEKAQEIYLESCAIQFIHDDAFKGLNSLSKLSLDDNYLHDVPSEAFAHLGALRYLYISSNNLSYIQSDSFEYLVSLEELYLNNGPLLELCINTFKDLRSLKKLEITNNINLTKVCKGTFRGLKNLNHLSLHSNSIPYISDDFDSANLKIIDLRNNPLLCGCELKWLTKWLQKLNESSSMMHKNKLHASNVNSHNDDSNHTLSDSISVSDLLNLTCTGPAALAGKPIIELPDNKLECLDPSSELNVYIGFATLVIISIMMTTVCLVNFCRNKKHLFIMLKENLAQNHISMIMTHDIHKNADNLKKETQFDNGDYETVDYSQPVYTVNGDQFMYYEAHQYSHHM